MTAPAPYRLRRDTQPQGDRAGSAPASPAATGSPAAGLRLAFVISCVLPGPQFVAYLLLWVLIPAD